MIIDSTNYTIRCQDFIGKYSTWLQTQDCTVGISVLRIQNVEGRCLKISVWDLSKEDLSAILRL